MRVQCGSMLGDEFLNPQHWITMTPSERYNVVVWVVATTSRLQIGDRLPLLLPSGAGRPWTPSYDDAERIWLHYRRTDVASRPPCWPYSRLGGAINFVWKRTVRVRVIIVFWYRSRVKSFLTKKITIAAYKICFFFFFFNRIDRYAVSTICTSTISTLLNTITLHAMLLCKIVVLLSSRTPYKRKARKASRWAFAFLTTYDATRDQ